MEESTRKQVMAGESDLNQVQSVTEVVVCVKVDMDPKVDCMRIVSLVMKIADSSAFHF